MITGLTSVLDRTYPLADAAEGMRYVMAGPRAARSPSPWYEAEIAASDQARRAHCGLQGRQRVARPIV